MKLSEIYKIADSIAPKALSDEMCQNYGWYDNSGILVNTDEEVNSILFSLDLTMAAVDEAIEKGVKLIITHHPAIYGKISRIDYEDSAMLGTKLIKCIKTLRISRKTRNGNHIKSALFFSVFFIVFSL